MAMWDNIKMINKYDNCKFSITHIIYHDTAEMFEKLKHKVKKPS